VDANRSEGSLMTTNPNTTTEGGWQDISSAPTEKLVLIYCPTAKWMGSDCVLFGYLHVVFNGHVGIWTREGRCGPVCVPKDLPTHWMPLPAAPVSA